MLLVVVALATHTRGLPYGVLPPQLQTRQYIQMQNLCNTRIWLFSLRLGYIKHKFYTV